MFSMLFFRILPPRKETNDSLWLWPVSYLIEYYLNLFWYIIILYIQVKKHFTNDGNLIEKRLQKMWFSDKRSCHKQLSISLLTNINSLTKRIVKNLKKNETWRNKKRISKEIIKYLKYQIYKKIINCEKLKIRKSRIVLEA